jgi:hypothetical protein
LSFKDSLRGRWLAGWWKEIEEDLFFGINFRQRRLIGFGTKELFFELLQLPGSLLQLQMQVLEQRMSGGQSLGQNQFGDFGVAHVIN